ncbi:MAG: hypothetical protein ABR519_01125 [Bacteroidales bacterium]
MKKRSLLKAVAGTGVLMAAIVFLYSCGSGGSKEPSMPAIEITEIDEATLQDVREAEKIFYSLPSPLESAMLVKSAGAEFNETLLNPVSSADRYSTNRAMALNLGIYTCDLSFSSLYDQTQLVIDYMNAAKKMADGLGILDAISEETIYRLEENVNNRDVIMDIVSETFLNSNSYLEDNEQPAIASMVLVGGWMEGLYIATQLVDMGDFDSDRLVGRIIDQKLSVGIMLKLLADNNEHPAIDELIDSMASLKRIFDKINISTTKITPEIDRETNVTLLKSEISSDMTPEIFTELATEVAKIRSSFVN